MLCENLSELHHGRYVLPATAKSGMATNGSRTRSQTDGMTLEFDDSAKAVCRPGFHLSGPDNVRCMANRTFTERPKCVDIDEWYEI